VNLGAVILLAWLWWGGRKDLRAIEKGLVLAAAARAAQEAQEATQDGPPLRGARPPSPPR